MNKFKNIAKKMMCIVFVIVMLINAFPIQVNAWRLMSYWSNPVYTITGLLEAPDNWAEATTGLGNYMGKYFQEEYGAYDQIKELILDTEDMPYNRYHIRIYGDDINWIRDNLPNLERLEVKADARFAGYIFNLSNEFTDSTTFDGSFHFNQGVGGHQKIKYVLEHTERNYNKVKHIIDYAFNACPSLLQVEFSEVNTLGVAVFANCTALPSISLPKLTTVPVNTLSGCTSLTSVSFPVATRAESQAFMDCISLPSINLPNCSYIGTDAFKNCTALKSVGLPKVNEVGWSAFYNCTTLESVSLPEVLTIYNYAFNNNKALTRASFPKVTSFRDWAFSDCSNFAAMELGATPPSVGYNAFYGCPANRAVYVPKSAIATYKAVNDGNTSDNLWYGWRIAEPVTISAVPINATTYGGNDGKIQVLAQGGTGVYQYSKDGGTSWQNDREFTGLSAGAYIVQAKDDFERLSNTFSVQVNYPNRVTINISKTDVTNYGQNEGEIYVTAGAGASGTYEYSIDNGISWQDNNTFSSLAAGEYKVLARDKGDAGNVSLLENVIISQPADVTFSVSKTNSTIHSGNNGIIAITAQGGTGSYEYSIDNGVLWQDSNTFSNMYAGTYAVRVRDKAQIANASVTTSIDIFQPEKLAISVSHTDVSSKGRDDGSITISATGGNGTYEYSIDEGASWQDSNEFKAILASTYKVMARDKADTGNVSDAIPTTINYPNQVTTTIAKTDVTADGASDGGIIITSSGGNGTYEYSINAGAKWQNNNEFNNLSVGSYRVLARDKTDTENVSGENIVTISIPDDTCVDLASLTINAATISPNFNRFITAYKASVPYTTDKITVSPTLEDSDAMITVNGKDPAEPVSLNVGENAVTIAVTDKDGVKSKIYQIIVSRKEVLSINEESLPIGIVNVAYNASFTAEGGTAPYKWTAVGLPPELNLSESNGEITGTLLNAGSYTVEVKVTDSNGIEASKSLTLKVNLGCGNGGYIIQSNEDAGYTKGYTKDAIPIITVKNGMSGFKFFSVSITPVAGHVGNEVCVFVHMRNGKQIGINACGADFDSINFAQAAFNVQPGDIIKVYIVERLTNDSDINQNIL